MVVKRKNGTLQETDSSTFLGTACHIHNRIVLRIGTSCTIYQLWKGRKPNVNLLLVISLLFVNIIENGIQNLMKVYL